MIHGVPLVVVFLSRIAGIPALSKIARIFAIRVRVMTVGVTLERRTVCAFGGSGGGQAQKRREGESRGDLRRRRLPGGAAPFEPVALTLHAVSIARMSPHCRFVSSVSPLIYRVVLSRCGRE